MATLTGKSLTNNVLLTISLDQSDESQEFLCLDDAHIKKEEENIGGVRYRIVNPLRTSINGGVAVPNTSSLNAMLPTNVQLPNVCDIYLVKEYVEEQGESTQFAADLSSAGHKLETGAYFTRDEGGDRQFPRCNDPQLMSKPAVTAGTGNVAYGTDTHNKRSYILETYKKRDDKRRATHNEVERRRRDKINSWIFKLKEMLPDISSNPINTSNTSNSNNNAVVATVTTATTTKTGQEGSYGHYSRTQPNDSKSQILFKACEYIRTMQEELKSLRECVLENENLRVKNQLLQTELDQLKQNETNQNLIQNRHHNQNVSNSRDINNASSSSNNNNDSLNVTLSTLNSSGCIFAASSLGTAASYTKRELIIRDYVD